MVECVRFLRAYNGTRPVILTNNGFRALIDTGAENNIWYADRKILDNIGVDQKIVLNDNIKGVTGHSIDTRLYTVDIKISNLIWSNVHMLCPVIRKFNTKFDLILGMSLFQDMILTVDYINRLVKFECPDGSINRHDSLMKLHDNTYDVELRDGIWVVSNNSDEDDCILEDLTLD